MEMGNKKHIHTAEGHAKPYKKLLLMTVLSFISMYVLMYAMVDAFANIFSNANQIYMAGLMISPMIIIEISLMGSMYINKKSMHC